MVKMYTRWCGISYNGYYDTLVVMHNHVQAFVAGQWWSTMADFARFVLNWWPNFTLGILSA